MYIIYYAILKVHDRVENFPFLILQSESKELFPRHYNESRQEINKISEVLTQLRP